MSWRGSTGHIDANVPDYQKMLQGRYPSSGWSSSPSNYSSYSNNSRGASQTGHYMTSRHTPSSYDRSGSHHNYTNSYQPSKYGLTSESSYSRNHDPSFNTLEIDDESSFQSDKMAFVDKNYGILGREFDLGPFRSRKIDYSSDSGTRRVPSHQADYSSDSGTSYRRHRPKSADFDLEIPSPETTKSYPRTQTDEIFSSPLKSQVQVSDYMRFSDNQSSHNDDVSAEHVSQYSPRTDLITSSDTSHTLQTPSHKREINLVSHVDNEIGTRKDGLSPRQDASHQSDGDSADHRPSFLSPPLYKGDIRSTPLAQQNSKVKGHKSIDLTHWQQQHQQSQSNTSSDMSPRTSYRHVSPGEEADPYKEISLDKYHHEEPVVSRGQNGIDTSPRQHTGHRHINHIKSAAEAIIRDKDAIIEDLRDQLNSKMEMVKEYENKLRRALMSRGGNSDQSATYSKMQELEYRNAELRTELAKLRMQKDTEVEDLEIKLGGVEHEVVQLKSALRKAQPNVAEMKEKLMEKDQEVDEWKSKYSSLRNNYEELKEKLGGLERYLSDLPTIEEYTKTAEELATCREENELKSDQVSDLEKRLSETTQMLSEREMTIQELEVKQQQLGSKMRELSSEIKHIKSEGEGKALSQAQEELAETKEAKERIAMDLEKAKKLLELNHRRLRHLEAKTQTDLRQVQERLSQEEESVMVLREEICAKEEQMAKLKKSLKEFASKNQDLMDESLILKEQLSQVERMSDDENVKLQRRFVKEMSICFTELQSLVQICVQRAEGKDPNISLLLGMKGFSLDEDEEGAVGGATKDDRTLKHWFTKLKELRGEVEEVRNMICNKYAEEMGDNLNCATQ